LLGSLAENLTVSLTSILNEKDSFPRRFIDERFSHLRTLSRECNRTLRSRGLIKLAPIHEHKVVSMLVGTAVDYRVRAYFRRHIHKTNAVMHGLTFLCNLKEFERPYIDPERNTNIEAIGDGWYWEEFEVTENPWYWRRRRRVAERLLSSFGNFVAKVKPERRRLAPEAEERFCRYCILFAYLDFIGRSPYGNSAVERMVLLGSPKVGNMLRAVDANIVADVVALSTKFYEQQSGAIKKFKKVAIGGILEGSGDIGGADFDLIVDGCLMELKTTLQPKITTAHLRQLVGYWLLDYHDAWRLRSASITLVRHGHTQHFDVYRDLVGSNSEISAVRSEFRRVIQGTAKLERASITPGELRCTQPGQRTLQR